MTLSAGIGLPAAIGVLQGTVTRWGVAMALAMAAIIALCTAVVDAAGARRSGNATAYNQ